MAASKGYLARTPNYRFLPNDQVLSATDSLMFELDESDVWNSVAPAHSPEFRKSGSRISRKQSSARPIGSGIGKPASLPVNVPDWSKILKDEYRENRRRDSDDYDYDDDDDLAEEYNGGARVPPHELLMARRSGIVSFSVHEGIGRTLKGRDLSRVRNAIWQKTGFED